MKKIASLVAFVALSAAALSAQGFDYEWQVISRLDGQGVFSDGGNTFDLGASSIYTQFEGSFSDKFDILVVANPLLYGSVAENYTNLGRSDEVNFLNYCLGTFHLGNFDIALGKNNIFTCGTEFDPWDWDCFDGLYSSYWRNVAAYQWGGHVAYTTPSEMTTISLQMVSSPWGEHPFGSGLWCYSAQWTGEYFDGVFSPIYSITAMESADGQFDWIASIGQFITLGDLGLELDYYNVCGYGEDPITGDWITYLPGNTFSARAVYPISDKFELAVKGVAEAYRLPGADSVGDYMFSGGANLNWFPLADSQDLRVHAVAGYNAWYGGAFANLGVTWTLPIH